MSRSYTPPSNPILIIVGPTASGKSGLAVEIAKKLNGEIISADSRQVYKGLDIGTGKVTTKEMGGIPHHLLDVKSPKNIFTAHEYVRLGRTIIQDIQSRRKIPIVVGGTGFYIDALVGRIRLPDVPPDLALRKQLDKKSAEQLFTLLQKDDPRRAQAMNTPSERNNKIRLIRALEIALSQTTVPQITSEHPRAAKLIWIGITTDPDELRERITKRLKSRLKIGMIAEARQLHAKGLSYKRMEELGLEYRSLARFLKGIITRTELESELNRDISQYAKRQLTYWKRNHDIQWFKRTDINAIVIMITNSKE